MTLFWIEVTILLLAFLQTAQEPSLFDKPQFVEGKFEAAVDAGAHASAGPAARSPIPPIAVLKLPAARPTGSALHDQAMELESKGQPLEAAKLFARAVKADPSPAHILDTAVHLMSHGAAAAAARVLTDGLRLHPRNADLRLAMGAAQFGLGRFETAMKELLAANDPRAFEGLALIAQAQPSLALALVAPLAESPFHQAFADREHAESLLKRAIAADPDHERAHFELARVYLDQQRNKDAEGELQAVIRLNPDHELAQYRLAQLLQRAGRRAEAEPHFAAYRRLHAKRLEAEETERRTRVLFAETAGSLP